jgi:Cof subfamily protein (haloacid dehalogenase superfamily)
MMIKLLAIDIDGTLINFERPNISKKVKNTVMAAKRLGVYVVLISGRNYYSMKRYLEDLGIEEYGITTNGGIVLDLKTGKAIIENEMKKDIALGVYKKLEEKNIPYSLFAGLNVYVAEKHRNQPTIELLAKEKDNVIVVDDMERFILENKMNKFMFMDEDHTLDALRDYFEEKYGDCVNVEYGFEKHMEIYPKCLNKGMALEALAEQLEIPMDEVMAIGDAENDISMLEIAGIGVAMGNAIKNVKDHADYVTKSVDEDGVAYAIEKFIIKKCCNEDGEAV